MTKNDKDEIIATLKLALIKIAARSVYNEVDDYDELEETIDECKHIAETALIDTTF